MSYKKESQLIIEAIIATGAGPLIIIVPVIFFSAPIFLFVWAGNYGLQEVEQLLSFSLEIMNWMEIYLSSKFIELLESGISSLYSWLNSLH
mmetsp:Transcript_11516/g.17361  ORF Transcript_11516/g.17361 Transcript_11516/m.17361 type:complete len:91 (+) Transcript_11516:519-791(+)